MDHIDRVDIEVGYDEDDIDPLAAIGLGRLLGKRDAPERVADAELRGVIRLAILTAEGHEVRRRATKRHRA